MTKRFALLSVSDKSGIEKAAQALVDQGVDLLSTGGTLKYLEEAGFEVQAVENYTGFPEMMGGRVKTLHPKIHGGLLSDLNSEDHQKAMAEENIQTIDFLIVNLYPFKETVLKDSVTLAEAIENIDIGGPSMLRSAAKNFNRVSVVTDPCDYPEFISQLEVNGETSEAYRFYLASKVFELTSHYDTLISQYMNKVREKNQNEKDWPHITKTYTEKKELRYGENSHQNAAFYKDVFAGNDTLAGANQLHGKELSYNNLKDADAALKIVMEFSQPAAIGLKHMNPCGAAVGQTVEQAFDRCFLADSMSIYGGIVAVNRPVTKELADKLSKIFLEIVIAPSFNAEALDTLTKKKNIRLLEIDISDRDKTREEELVSVTGGALVQERDLSEELEQGEVETMPETWGKMTNRGPNDSEIKSMNFLMKIVKHVKSNAIVVGNEYMTLGIGAGQMNRVGAAELALKQAVSNEEAAKAPFVMASDAFLPMDDTVKLADEYKVSAVIQPGGSIHDKDSVEFCNEKDIAMVKTSVRHFRH